ncbi:MAG TPA: hypothetical protein VG860_21125 [Terriglobia bacterium]|jgi:hypothetical protein|nr:hypothetical protein [Terriglobia bacterium]
MAKSLNVRAAVARQVIPLFQVQGYIIASGGQWGHDRSRRRRLRLKTAPFHP